jgi:hypothetical protein
MAGILLVEDNAAFASRARSELETAGQSFLQHLLSLDGAFHGLVDASRSTLVLKHRIGKRSRERDYATDDIPSGWPACLNSKASGGCESWLQSLSGGHDHNQTAPVGGA